MKNCIIYIFMIFKYISNIGESGWVRCIYESYDPTHCQKKIS